MIFVTVGTHEQPFNRLIECVDKLITKDLFEDEVIIQTGFSTYEPKNCKWSKLLTYSEMKKNISEARVVITHGGPASFIMPIQIGKIPIVVPRQQQFDEHVNNHQVDFVKLVAERMGTIITVYDIDNLKNTLLSYDNIVSTMSVGINSNNAQFNKQLDIMVASLFSEG